MIQRFRNDGQAAEFIGERSTTMGNVLFLARPIRSEPQCAVCHSVPSVAPRPLIARYGSDNGFGWQTNEVVGAQIVSVPFTRATMNAERALRAFMVSLAAVFGTVFLAVNGLLYLLVIRPVRRMAALADRLSLGEPDVPQFPQKGAAEMASLARSFDRLRKSLEKTLRLLET